MIYEVLGGDITVKGRIVQKSYKTAMHRHSHQFVFKYELAESY